MSSFKRDTDLVAKVNGIAENLSAEDKKAVEELIRKYESTTYEEYSDRHEFYADMVSDMTNDYGFDDEGLATKMANEHPTLQQSFARFVVKFIKKMAEKAYWDGRNERAVSLAKVMNKAIEESENGAYLPMI